MGRDGESGRGRGGRERDLVLAPNEYAFILDRTKGQVTVYVGPHKTSLADTDDPVMFSSETKQFERCDLAQALRTFITAPEGWYVVLYNPGEDDKHPGKGLANSLADLQIGRRVNIQGPTSFPLWPGQMAEVVQGHKLRSDQYLEAMVYDDAAANANREKAVSKPQTENPDSGKEGSDGEDSPKPPKKETKKKDSPPDPDYVTGQRLVIKGTDVSFYIPPTGIKIVRSGNKSYVRDAVSLERLEYCILIDESGDKRYVRGPEVVFPKPTERFKEKNGTRKFTAYELSPISGLYIKVIAPYEANKKQYKEGEELFITGEQQAIYFPRAEHSIISYAGSEEIHFAVAIPTGEGRYVMDRLSGEIRKVEGPAMLLCDPRKEVIIRRVLSPDNVKLWYPGNDEAVEFNEQLQAIMDDSAAEYATEQVLMAAVSDDFGAGLKGARAFTGGDRMIRSRVAAEVATRPVAGDKFKRNDKFTQPRMVTLNTKYEGIPLVNPWTGFAVKVVDKKGKSSVVQGPKPVLLNYDEHLEAIELSTGVPKSYKNPLHTVYLRVLNNRVTDIIRAETKDFTQVELKVSFRVNFEGDPNKWFDLQNYVGFLTDHMRSLLRNAIKKVSIEEFYTDSIDMIRDSVLGKPVTTETGEKRPGRAFEENGMRVYDVEVLNVQISNSDIRELLTASQHDAVQKTIELTDQRRRLEVVKEEEQIEQNIAEARSETERKKYDLKVAEIQKELTVRIETLASQTKQNTHQLQANLDKQETLDQINAAELSRAKAGADQELLLSKERIEQELHAIMQKTKALVERAGAISPQMVAALQAFSDRDMLGKIAESMSPLGIIKGAGVGEVFGQLLEGTSLGKVFNGSGKSAWDADDSNVEKE